MKKFIILTSAAVIAMGASVYASDTYAGRCSNIPSTAKKINFCTDIDINEINDTYNNICKIIDDVQSGRIDQDTIIKEILRRNCKNYTGDITECTTRAKPSVEPSTEATTQKITEKPVQRPAKPQPTTEKPTQPPTRPQPTTEKPTQPPTKPQPATEKPTQPTTKRQPAYESSTETTTSAPVVNGSEANALLALVNRARAENGLSPLSLDSRLSAVAQKKAEDMKSNNYFSHTSPTYGTPFNMIKNAGISYKTAGENIAKGQKDAQAVFNAWMNSSGHKANILNKNYTHMGLGVTSGSGRYWSQMFIG